MPCCTADIFNIACADTFLTGRHTMAGRLNLPRKIRFQWRHPCADQKQAGIIFWNQRKTFQPQMFFLRFEKDKYASRISLPFMICPLRYLISLCLFIIPCRHNSCMKTPLFIQPDNRQLFPKIFICLFIIIRIQDRFFLPRLRLYFS